MVTGIVCALATIFHRKVLTRYKEPQLVELSALTVRNSNRASNTYSITLVKNFLQLLMGSIALSQIPRGVDVGQAPEQERREPQRMMDCSYLYMVSYCADIESNGASPYRMTSPPKWKQDESCVG